MPTAETLSPELTVELRKQLAEVVQRLNEEVGKLNKEINASKVELTRIQNQKKDDEVEVERLRGEQGTLKEEIIAQKASQAEGLKNFQDQMNASHAKAEERIIAAEEAEEKASNAERAHQEARSAHVSKVTETYDLVKTLTLQAVALLNEIKKLASPEEKQGDQAPTEQPAG